MKRLSFVKSSICVLAVSLTAMAAPEPVPDEAQQMAQGQQSDVIVIMRDQVADVPPVRRAMVWLALVAVGAVAVAKAFYSPASQAALPNVLAPEDLATGNAVAGSAWGKVAAF